MPTLAVHSRFRLFPKSVRMSDSFGFSTILGATEEEDKKNINSMAGGLMSKPHWSLNELRNSCLVLELSEWVRKMY